jgi:hypothetical protein
MHYSSRLILILFTMQPFLLRSQSGIPKLPQLEIHVRCDDIGICHAVNAAIKEALDAVVRDSSFQSKPQPNDGFNLLEGGGEMKISG